jgi:DNA repair exonuclease SbcCD nuclease subunit
LKIKTLADPHLGKAFVQNVPLHRRGERERIVWAEFERQLGPDAADLHVMLGDLFDGPIVPLVVIERAANLYLKAARRHPQTRFFVLSGNHDASRDLEKVSAFDLFKDIVANRLDNLQVLKEVTSLENVTFFPWSPTVSAEDSVENLPSRIERGVAFGHWDVDLRSDPFNLIPTLALKEQGFERAYTGHVHLRDWFERDGVDVHVVGSMIPLAHGEDADGTTYVTMSLAEARDADPEALRSKCLRIKLAPGEVYDLQIDCLQLQIERAESSSEELEVSLGDFDLSKLFSDVLTEHAVPDSIASQVRSRWEQGFSLGR